MLKHIKPIIIFIILSSNSFGQVGTTNTYKFLNISSSARISALGNNIVSIDDDDISLANENPAVLKDEMIRSLSLSHKFFFSGISSQNLDYGFKIGKINLPFHAGIQFMNYGQADMADIYGDISGTVSGSDLAFLLGASYKLYENLNLGLNTRFIYSNIGPYNSFGMTVDLGAMYHLKGKNFDIGFVIKNLGGTIDPYADEKEPAPMNVMVGISKRLEHLPFRLNITATHLNRFNLSYDDPNGENNIILTDENQDKSKFAEFSDNFFRHLIFSGEFLLGKNDGPMRLRFAYNHRKAKEMSVYPYRSFAGFSFGFGLKMKKFTIDYAYNIHNLAGGKSHLTLSTNLNNFKKKL